MNVMSETTQTQAEAQTDDLMIPVFVADHCDIDHDNIPAEIAFDVDEDTDTDMLHEMMNRYDWRVSDTDFLNGVIHFVPQDN